jgi:hypothetical protein
MNTHDCKAIQREIDETGLDARLTVEANEHLSRCDKCRRFHDDRRTLRGLMAELETVGAPADFDFRLRARLAREKPSNGFHSLLLSARPIAAVALVVLIAVVAVVVKKRMSSAGNPASISRTAIKGGSTPQDVRNTATPSEIVPSHKDSLVNNAASATGGGLKPAAVTGRNTGGPRNTAAQRTRALAGSRPRFSTRDSAVGAAPVITPDSNGNLVVVPVGAQVIKVSIDNGSGARTVFLPPVSFGLQRLLAREASFNPVSSAKGNW